MPLTASNLVHAIGKLRTDIHYNYINPKNLGKIIINDIVRPEGPISILRYNPLKGIGPENAKESKISSEMLWRIANAVNENCPLNFDRVLGASYNTRSALETLLAHTPEFYYCYPGRIEYMNNEQRIRGGHKHLLYKPNDPHQLGILTEAEVNLVISEIPTTEAVYEALKIPNSDVRTELDIEIQRRHAQIQIALLKIGVQLGSRVWLASNDRGIEYNGIRIGEMEGVIQSLESVSQIQAYSEAIRAALLIDLIWFRNARFMPAVFEVEHSTGIRSGLSRMKNFYDRIPPFSQRWVIVADDRDRQRVFDYSNQPQFLELSAKFMSYSSVEELYSLCQRRQLSGESVTDEFLDCFMENCVE